MVAVNKYSHGEARPAWLGHTPWKFFFRVFMSIGRIRPILSFKLALIEIKRIWIEDHLCIVVLLGVGEDAIELFHVALAR